MLIRAVVHARLFGLRLLTLDARVVVAEADPMEMGVDALAEVDPTIVPLARDYAPLGDPRGIAHAPRRDAVSEPNGGVGHARELLAEGADTLAGLRRPPARN